MKWTKNQYRKPYMAIPNFDKKIFKQITGIDVDSSASEISIER